jgi:hypothetical protein
MAVGVEGGHEKNGDLFEEIRLRGRGGGCRDGRGCVGRRRWIAHPVRWIEQLSQRDEARVLAVAFSGMDAGLQHEKRNATLPDRDGIEGARSRDQKGPHRPAFGGAAVLERADRVGKPGRQQRGEPLHLVRAAGVPEIRCLGYGSKLCWHRLRLAQEPDFGVPRRRASSCATRNTMRASHESVQR